MTHLGNDLANDSATYPISREGLAALGSPVTGPHGAAPTGDPGNGWLRRRPVRILLGLILPALILLAWHLSTESGFFRPWQLPTPASVLAAAVDLIERGQLATHILISTQRVLLGFVIGAVISLLGEDVRGYSATTGALFLGAFGAMLGAGVAGILGILLDRSGRDRS